MTACALKETSLFLLIASFLLNPTSVRAEEPADASFLLSIVDVTCEEARVHNLMVFARGIVPGAQLEACATADSPQGQEKLSQTQRKILPVLFFEAAIEKHPQFATLLKQNYIERIGQGYISRGLAFPILPGYFLIGRERIPNQLEIFGAAFCRASQVQHRILMNFQKAQPDKRLNIRLRFFVREEAGRLISPHGNEEIWEDGLQAVIQRDYPDKLRDYLLARQDLTAPQAIQVAGLSKKELSAKQAEGLLLLKADAAFAQELEIKKAPVLLWENQYLLYHLEGLRWYAPFENLSVFHTGLGMCAQQPNDANAGQAATDPTVSQSPSGGCSGGCGANNSGVPLLPSP